LILCTNDDGVSAFGLKTLAQVCRQFDQVAVLAPDRERSICSHGLNPSGVLELAEVDHQVYSLTGTPADCTRIALLHFEQPPSLVCSGINHGGNLGVDALYSGTMAAAREAYIRGVSAISFSMVLHRDVEPDWELAQLVVRSVLQRFRDLSPVDPIFWNVNIPVKSLPPHDLVECGLDPTPMNLDYTREGQTYNYVGNYFERPRKAGLDVDHCFAGHPVLTDMGQVFFGPANQR